MLLDELKARQGEMTDVEFARLMGIKRATWNATRLGHKRIGEVVIKATVRTFPELQSQVVSFLAQNEPRVADL